MTARRIVAICTHGASGIRYSVGSRVWGEPETAAVTSITRLQKNGQMADVEWFLVVTDGGTVYEVNGAFVEFVKEADDE